MASEMCTQAEKGLQCMSGYDSMKNSEMSESGG